MRIQLLFTIVAVFCLNQLEAQITILESSREKLIFEWKILSLDTVSINSGRDWFTAPSFNGQNSVIGSYQKPIAPAYSFFVGVPQQGEVNVTIDPIKVVSMHFAHPIKLQTDSSRQIPLNFQSQWISNPLYSNIGSFRTIQLVLKPFLYSALTGNGTVMLSGRVTIEFPASTGLGTVPAGSRMAQMMKKMLLNYSVAQSWGSARKLSKRMVENYPLPAMQKMVYFKIGDGHLEINEGTINENGIVKIPADAIIKSFGTYSQILISRVALFSSFKGALPEEIPQKGAIPDGVSEVPLFRYDANGNGILDKEDYLLAYVSGLSDWTFKNNYEFKIDNYAELRTYWLTIKTQNGLTLEKFSQPVSTSIPVNYFTNRMFCKQSKAHKFGSEGGNNWVWELLNKNNDFGYEFPFPLLDTTYPGQMTIYPDPYGLAVSFAGSTILKDSNNIYNISKWGNKNFHIDYTYNDDAYYELDNIEFKYRSKLLLDTAMTIFSSNDSGVVSYKLSGIKNKNVFIFRISSDEKNVSLVDTIKNSILDYYTWADSGHLGVKYFACDDSGFDTLPVLRTPENLQSTFVCNDLRSTLHSTDYLIITPRDFLKASERLATHKKKMGFKNPCIVDINEIYRSFSGGNKDPVAIRNFLAYVKRNWTGGNELLYVVLMGIGHNDPKNYKTGLSDFIPIYQYNSDLEESFYSFTEPDTNLVSNQNYEPKPQLVIGRFPCSTQDEADIMVNKVIEMEDPETADFGAWRNRAMFVADDDMQGIHDDEIVGQSSHFHSSDRVFNMISSKCPSLDLRKVYLFEYEWNAAREKPGAKQAILNQINNGVAYVNYFGHGDVQQWADEKILKNNDVSLMSNNKQYPLIASFSCNVGKFDDPGRECLSVALVKAPSNGACATISSTRLAYATENENLARAFYSNLFDSSETIIGDAYFMAKSSSTSSSHNSYSLLGDPSLQFLRPGKKVSLQVSTASSTKSDSLVDTLQALQQIKISGFILKNDNSIDSDFGNGTTPAYVNIGLFNAPDTASRKDGGATDSLRYMMPGAPIFLRVTTVNNGKFEQTIRLPRNLFFGKPGVKLTGYAWKEKVRDVAAGIKNDLLFWGSGPTQGVNNDTTGPRISVRPVYDNADLRTEAFSFTDKITSLLPLKFQIDLYDESGIDVSGNGPDEGLIYEIPGVLNKKSVNNKFISKDGDYRQGSASVEIEKNTINPGTYELAISARDLIGNIALRKIPLEVTSQEEIKLDHVFNFPNPFKLGQKTKFYFYPSNTTFEESSADIYIKIYSLSGRLLMVFRDARNGVEWDGRDQAGNILSPNVYLFQITQVSTFSNNLKKTTKSKIQKIVIHPPR